MKKRKHNGSYTIEAAIYIPIILFMLFKSLELGIDYWQISRNREIFKDLQMLDTVKEFYGYQMLEEVRKEMSDD